MEAKDVQTLSTNLTESVNAVEGDARLTFVREGKKCNMKFSDADVQRPLASVRPIVDEGNVVVFRPQRHVHREYEHMPEESEEEERLVVQLDARMGPILANGNLQAGSVDKNAEEIRERCEF